MKILKIALGTRGDMEPPLAIGKLLQAQGHQVICLLPEQFCNLAHEADIKCISLGPEWHDFMQQNLSLFTDASVPWWKKLGALWRANKQGMAIHEKIAARIHIHVAKTNPDKILYSAKAIFAAVYGIEDPTRVIFHCPLPYMHYAKGHAHAGFKGKNFGSWLNKLSFRLIDKRVVSLLAKSAKQLGIAGVTNQQLQRVLDRQKVIYTLSPSLFARPAEWPENIKLLGYHERDKTLAWQPSEALQQLLSNHKKILFITFGSMANNAPEQHTEMIIRILKRHGIAAIINTFSGGLIKPQGWQDQKILFVEQIPYDWLFSKITAVIHHGGAGTIHMATKHACPSLIIPHAVDQYVWNELVWQQQLGPKGMEMGKLKEPELEQKILDLLTNPSYRDNAQKLAKAMNEESDLAKQLCDEIIK